MTRSTHRCSRRILGAARRGAGRLGVHGEIGPETRFVADLGLESLEIVVLSTMVQQQYGRLPFPQFFDEIGQRPRGGARRDRRGARRRSCASTVNRSRLEV